jgi:hypothetical protein
VMGGDRNGGLLRSEHIIAREKKLLRIEKGRASAGLALSGGGIRSASFGLGVLQAFLENHVLEKIDYLSTVSGGGYIGAALTWLRKWHAGADGDFFDGTNPLGKQHQGARSPAEGSGEIRNNFLSFLRQRGNYLAPTPKLNVVALAATVMRSMIVSLLVYMSMLVVVVSLMMSLSHLAFKNDSLAKLTEAFVRQEKNAPPPASHITIDWSKDVGDGKVASHIPSKADNAWRNSCLFRFAFCLSALSVGFLLLMAIGYSVLTAVRRVSKAPKGRPEAPRDDPEISRYTLRTGVQIMGGRFLVSWPPCPLHMRFSMRTSFHWDWPVR